MGTCRQKKLRGFSLIMPASVLCISEFLFGFTILGDSESFAVLESRMDGRRSGELCGEAVFRYLPRLAEGAD